MNIKFLLSAFLVASAFASVAQDGNKAYAITGKSGNSFNWTDIREIDLSSGKVLSTVFEDGVSKYSFTNTNREQSKSNIASPTSSMVAAAAYDKKHGKLFFAPMRNGELNWLDLSSNSGIAKFYTEGKFLVGNLNAEDEANNFTRMVINSDGNGYAITNDANHLVQFTTGKKTIIKDLGNLVDDDSNHGISVHNKCSSWGGDIVADAYGKLYLFTASHNVFKVDIISRIATFVGTITGLSGTYTVNGAAVDNSDNVVIGSANSFDGFYKVNMKDLSAVKLQTPGQIINASDLANSNLLYSSQLKNTLGSALLPHTEILGNETISVYPNPVNGNDFKITFDKNSAGIFNMAITDVQGRVVMNKQIYLKSTNQVEPIHLPSKPAAGIYLLKITDSNKKTVFADKLVIE